MLIPNSVLVCGLAGLAGQVLATPLHVVTDLLQHDAAKGLPHHHSLTKTMKNLYKREGVSNNCFIQFIIFFKLKHN